MNGNCEIKMMQTESLSVGRFVAAAIEERSKVKFANMANIKDLGSASSEHR